MKAKNLLVLSIGVVCWVIYAQIEHGGQEHGGKEQGEVKTQEPQNEDIRNTMSKYVKSQSKKTDGYFEVQDVDLDIVRKLKLLRVHERVGKTGDYYYSCADFEDTDSGDTLDLDIDVSFKDGNLEVADVRIHKLAGVARYTYDENDNRIPRGDTKSHLGKDSAPDEKEHGGKEHGGKEHGGKEHGGKEHGGKEHGGD